MGKLNVGSSGSIGNILGDPVKVIQTEDESQGEVIELRTEDNELGKTIDFGRVKIPFKPQFSGSGITINDDTKLQVEVEAGQLYTTYNSDGTVIRRGIVGEAIYKLSYIFNNNIQISFFIILSLICLLYYPITFVFGL